MFLSGHLPQNDTGSISQVEPSEMMATVMPSLEKPHEASAMPDRSEQQQTRSVAPSQPEEFNDNIQGMKEQKVFTTSNLAKESRASPEYSSKSPGKYER